ncbi:MAG: hypothetical protein H7123_00935 [Thermoleophilia bacterium]|nr:hypothetical protein [Thermoleophilia bacterium]
MAAEHDQIATAIIDGQAKIMGPVAYTMAAKVPGLTYAPGAGAKIVGDGGAALEKLVGEFAGVTGPLGARMCYMSAKPLLDKNPGVKVKAFDRF